MIRVDSSNNDSGISTESESPSLTLLEPKVTASIRLGIPPLTRTEEKSLAHALIQQLPADASFSFGQQWARRRTCEIISDNYSQPFSLEHIASEWFYDFLLRNPRVPIHFQSWFASVQSALPSSNQLTEIKIWQLGLVTRSMVPSACISSSSSSP